MSENNTGSTGTDKEAALKDLENNATVTFDDVKKEEPVTSLGKVVNREEQFKRHHEDEIKQKYGYHKIPVEYFPSRGMFYPLDVEVKIKSADTPQVRHFSAIDERDPFSVNEALNDLLVTCSQIKFGDKMVSHKDLCEEDRIHLILEIRSLTFPKGENKLAFTSNCEECDTENEIEIKNENFQHTQLPEEISKYYDYDERLFIVKTKTYGDIKLRPPSIGIMQIVTNYIKKQQESGKRKLDTEFIKCLAYMLTDWRNFNPKAIDNLSVEYHRWDKKRFSLMIKLIEWAKIAVDENMSVTCTNQTCGAEVTARITFPGGIKNLFVVSDFSDELL